MGMLPDAIFVIMDKLSDQIVYNPYHISNHPGPVSEMRNNWDMYVAINPYQ